MRTLSNQVAMPGPTLHLCLGQREFDKVGRRYGIRTTEFTSHGVTQWDVIDGRLVVLVALHDDYWPVANTLDAYALLVHEAVHVWQAYSRNIGESNPGDEQEAYAVQMISRTLMAEYKRRRK